jgi:protein-tyrosine phosphatase
MIDLHCHILPGLDDGPGEIDESIEMAEKAGEDGIHTIVATPHTLNGVYRTETGTILREVRRLQDALDAAKIKIRLLSGAEVRLNPGMGDVIAGSCACTLNLTGRYLLLEFPATGLPPGTENEIFALRLKGITPIIAHPERNLAIQRNLSLVERFVEMGAICQVTAMSITGEFGVSAERAAIEMIEAGLVHVIGSDAHSAGDRPPLLYAALEAAAEITGSWHQAESMVTTWPDAILNGRPLPFTDP